MLVYLPYDRVLATGDILVNGVVPTMLDANIRRWISTLEQLQRVDVDVFVPGRGPLMNQSDVTALRHSISARDI